MAGEAWNPNFFKVGNELKSVRTTVSVNVIIITNHELESISKRAVKTITQLKERNSQRLVGNKKVTEIYPRISLLPAYCAENKQK